METYLAEEFKKFESVKEELAKEHDGKFVLIKGNEVIGIFDKELDAIDRGIELYCDSPFLVNEIYQEPLQIRSFPCLRKT